MCISKQGGGGGGGGISAVFSFQSSLCRSKPHPLVAHVKLSVVLPNEDIFQDPQGSGEGNPHKPTQTLNR